MSTLTTIPGTTTVLTRYAQEVLSNGSFVNIDCEAPGQGVWTVSGYADRIDNGVVVWLTHSVETLGDPMVRMIPVRLETIRRINGLIATKPAPVVAPDPMAPVKAAIRTTEHSTFATLSVRTQNSEYLVTRRGGTTTILRLKDGVMVRGEGLRLWTTPTPAGTVLSVLNKDGERVLRTSVLKSAHVLEN